MVSKKKSDLKRYWFSRQEIKDLDTLAKTFPLKKGTKSKYKAMRLMDELQQLFDMK